MKKRLIFFGKLFLTTILMVYLFKTKGIDIKNSWNYIKHSNITLITIAFLMLMTGQFICSIRWKKILDHLEIKIRQLRLFQFYLIGMFFSLFFPSIIGGDFVKIYYVKKDSTKSLAYALTSVYLERAAGFLALLIYGLAGTLFYPMTMSSKDFRPIGWLGFEKLHLWVIPGTFLLAFLLANWILFGSQLYGIFIKLLNHFHLEKISEKVLIIRDSMQAFRSQPQSMAIPLVISFINIALVISMNWILAIALGIHVSLFVFASLIAIMTVLVMLPISINGIGVRENSYVVLLALVGVNPNQSFALSLVAFFLIVLSALPGGICYSLLKREIPTPVENELREMG